MRMRWEKLLFAHWPVDAASLEARLPRGLDLDLFEGQAWLGIIPFRMAGVRARWLPPIPGTSAFPELNVRTYVRYREQPGVWFFSLDAASPLAVVTARALYHLPYRHADMACVEKQESIDYSSRRSERDAPAADFSAHYRPISERFRSLPGTLEHWLTERYLLFSADSRGELFSGRIDHNPWPLQAAAAEIRSNTMTNGLGIRLSGPPALLHYAEAVEVAARPIRRVLG